MERKGGEGGVKFTPDQETERQTGLDWTQFQK